MKTMYKYASVLLILAACSSDKDGTDPIGTNPDEVPDIVDPNLDNEPEVPSIIDPNQDVPDSGTNPDTTVPDAGTDNPDSSVTDPVAPTDPDATVPPVVVVDPPVVNPPVVEPPVVVPPVVIDPPVVTCTLPTGAWDVTFVQNSNDCGENLPDVVFDPSTTSADAVTVCGPTAVTAYSYSQTASSTCVITRTEHCEYVTGVVHDITYTFVYDQAADSVTGSRVETWLDTDPCAANFSLTAARQ